MISVIPRKPGFGCGHGARVLSEVADLPREVLPELAESAGSSGRTTIRQAGEGIPAASRRPRADHLARPGAAPAAWSSRSFVDDRAPQVLFQVERLGVVLLEAPEGVVPPVAALEREDLRLLPADAGHRRQPAAFAPEVQYLEGCRRRPDSAVVGSEQHLVEAAFRVPGTRHHPGRVRRSGSRRGCHQENLRHRARRSVLHNDLRFVPAQPRPRLTKPSCVRRGPAIARLNWLRPPSVFSPRPKPGSASRNART